MFSPSKGEGQTARKAKKGGGKGSCGLRSERKAIVVCISRCGAAEVQLVLTEGQSARIRDRKPSLGVISPTCPHERIIVEQQGDAAPASAG